MSRQWYQTAWFRGLALFFGFAFIAGHAVDAIFLKDNDFTWHRNLGTRFLQGNPFAEGGQWYLLGRALFNTAPAMLPYRVARAVSFFLSLACLALTLVLMRRMTDPERRSDRATTFAVGAFSLALLWPYLSRDLQDCGLQTMLLAMLVAGGYSLWTGRSLWAGFWFGLAATFKTTPILFLAVLVWKRRWLASVAMVVVVIALNLAPALYLGVDETVRCHQKSWQLFQRIGQLEDIAENGIEIPHSKNRALMSVFARYLQTYPAGHALHHDHAGFLQFGDLDHATARHVAKAILFLLAVLIAWRMRGRWRDRAADLPGQMATTCLFCALLSPMCWRHHLMLALPALYLLVRDRLDQPRPSRWATLGMTGLLLSIWLPQRELMGKALTTVMMSYKLDCFTLVAVSLLVLDRPSRVALGQDTAPRDDLPLDPPFAAVA